ncbi:MAG TPA: hypothetical protein VH877_10810 [Polyangia bacterium]|nr:hypothetical protein [Polyangia bacterium]
MRRLIGSIMVAASVVSAGCSGPEALGTQRAALTSTDVDVAPECQGIITYANTASFEALDAFLPSNVALNIVGQRAVAPFASLADLLAVDQVAEYRLSQIAQAARTASYIGPSCIGVFDQLAVSADDEQAMVALINTISSTELHDILPNAWNGAVNLLGLRPFTNVQGISNTSGIGAVSLRLIRNAATLSRPFEQLADAVNARHGDSTLLRHFDWYTTVHSVGRYRLNGLTCFGIDPSRVPSGAEIRSNLATPAEVLGEVNDAVLYANRFNPNPIDPTAGVANLQQLTAGRTFFGCYVSYSNDPWSGNNMSFFVDPTSGLSILTETRWSE